MKPSLRLLPVLIGLNVLLDIAAGGGTPPPVKSPMTAEQAKQMQSNWAKHLSREVVATNSIGMKLVLIPPGEFLMGTTDKEYDRLMEVARGKPWARWFQRFARTETPAHRVTISKPFYLGATEVTVGQFRRFVKETGYNATGKAMKSDPEHTASLAGMGFENGKWIRKVGYDWQHVGYKMSDDHPVLNVTWYDAVAFCKWLSKKEGVTYRLPTEAEWAHACRAGTETRRFFGNDRDPLPDYAWGEDNSGNRPHPVGKKRPNPFGLYDIYGNLWEWCHDWSDYDWPARNIKGTYYAVSPKVDPQGPETGRGKVVRSGSFDFGARSAFRVWGGGPNNRRNHIGFRVAMTIAVSRGDNKQQGKAPDQSPKGNAATQPPATLNLAASLVKYEANPVLDIGPRDAFDDAHLGCLTVLQRGKTFYMWYEGSREHDPHGKPWKLGLATSEDGIHWSRSNENPIPGVTAGNKTVNVSRPVAMIGDLFYAWSPTEEKARGDFGFGFATLATSRNGTQWEKCLSSPVFPRRQDPSIRKIGDRFFMWYTSRRWSRGQKHIQIGLATSQPGVNNLDKVKWTDSPTNPVLSIGKPGDFDSVHLAYPRVLRIGGTFYMWYLGADKSRFRLGLATSSDGIHWTKSPANPVLNVGKPGTWDSGAIFGFDVLWISNRVHIWYAAAGTGRNGKKAIRIGYAGSKRP